MRDRALILILQKRERERKKKRQGLIFCTVSHLHARESHANMPYGTVGPGLISAASSTYQTFLGLQSLQFEGKTNGTKKKPKKKKTTPLQRCPLAATPRSQLSAHANDTMVGGYANAISLDLHPTTVNGCTDGSQTEMRPPSLAEGGRLAAILSEAVPIWMEAPSCGV